MTRRLFCKALVVAIAATVIPTAVMASHEQQETGEEDVPPP